MILKIFLTFVLLSDICYGRNEPVEAFENIDNNADLCCDQCNKDANYVKKADIIACQRGCRLFSICEWASSNLTEAGSECALACGEAYEDNGDVTKSCVSGCHLAFPLAKRRRNRLASQAQHIHLANLNQVFPLFAFDDEESLQTSDSSFGGLDGLMNQMLQSASRSFAMMRSFMPSYGTEIFEIDDGNTHQLIVIQHGQPEINTPVNKKILLNTDGLGFKTTILDRIESNLQTNVNRKSFENQLAARDEAQWKDDDRNGYLDRMKEQANSWWDCFTRKAGLPELVFFMFWASLTLLLMMTCMLQSSKPKLSVNGDLAYITDSKGDLPSYARAYPSPSSAKKSPYFLASVVQTRDEKLPLIGDERD